MKTRIKFTSANPHRGVVLAGIIASLAVPLFGAAPGEQPAAVIGVTTPAGSTGGVHVETIEPATESPGVTKRQLPWLGVSTDEVTEALTAQLGLPAGVGLVVTYVADGSPAAKAGVQKNDLLVEFDGQQLVHPAQLRKLVQNRQEGDSVKLAYLRGGKKETIDVTLSKTVVGLGLPGEELAWQGDLRQLQRQIREIPLGDAVRQQMEALRETLRSQFGPQQRQELQDAIRKEVDAARRAAERALKDSTNLSREAGAIVKRYRDLAGSVNLGDDARVTVRSSQNDVKTVVQSDETGVYVIVATPAKRLTVHDKSGRLVFDGEIETSEQQGKVPREIWEKVQVLVEKLKAGGDADSGGVTKPATSGARSGS